MWCLRKRSWHKKPFRLKRLTFLPLTKKLISSLVEEGILSLKLTTQSYNKLISKDDNDLVDTSSLRRATGGFDFRTQMPENKSEMNGSSHLLLKDNKVNNR